MIKLLLLAVIPFLTEHRFVDPKTVVTTNFYGSVTGIVDNAYIQSHGGGGVDTNEVERIANRAVETNAVTVATTNDIVNLENDKRDKTDFSTDEDGYIVTADNLGYVILYGSTPGIGSPYLGFVFNDDYAEYWSDYGPLIDQNSGTPFATGADLATKRDLTNNVCTADSFTDWRTVDVPPSDFVFYPDKVIFNDLFWSYIGQSDWYQDSTPYGNEDDLYVEFSMSPYDQEHNPFILKIKRDRISVHDEYYVTQSFVTNETAGVKSSVESSLGYPRNVTVGVRARVDAGRNGSVAIGTNSYVRLNNSIAIGADTTVTNGLSTAIGYKAHSHGTETFNVSQDIGRWYAGDVPVMRALESKFVQKTEEDGTVVYEPDPSGAKVAYSDRESLAVMMADASTNHDASCECVRTNMAAMLSTEISRSVESSLNTYVDRKTGIEFKGVYYDDCLYYVPTGNVFPPNE